MIVHHFPYFASCKKKNHAFTATELHKVELLVYVGVNFAKAVYSCQMHLTGRENTFFSSQNLTATKLTLIFRFAVWF